MYIAHANKIRESTTPPLKENMFLVTFCELKLLVLHELSYEQGLDIHYLMF